MSLRLPRAIRRLRALVTWTSRDADMQAEMTHHLDALVAESMRNGMSRAEAERDARRRFGSVLRLKETGHDERRSPMLADIARDVRHMSRGLWRTPGFAVAVVLMLAVGIGGNTAIFSVVDQVLLRPLPYPNGDQLLVIYERFGTGALRAESGQGHNVVSPANWLDWQRENRTLENIAVWRTGQVTLTGRGDPVRLNRQSVSAEFFPVLGVPALLGRTINDSDDRPNAPRVVVLSYHLWQQRFGGDRGVLGRIIQLNDLPAQIVGVMPAQFRFIYQDNDLWGALQLDRNAPWRETSGRFLNSVARLKPGATMASARADLDAVAARLAARYEFNHRSGVTLVPLREELTGQVQDSLLILYGAVAVLLSIACFNVANLLLVRATARTREIAVRTALGAGRASIVRQLLIESLVLAFAGGLLGIGFAHWSLDAIVALAPPELLRVPALAVDSRVLLYALAISLATGVAAGLVPAWLVGTRPMALSLRSGGRTMTHAPRVRQALVICQVAMTVVLLCGAGLFVRTIVALNETDEGFDTHDLLTLDLSLPRARYDDASLTAFYRRAITVVRAIPGVRSAAAANSLAVIGSPRGGTVFHRRGTPELPMSEAPAAVIRVVTPGYFRTLRIPVLKGREFAEADDANPHAGFVVNQAFVDAFMRDVDPLTSEISVWMQETNPYLPIIGVVGNVSEGSIRNGAQPTIFYDHALMPEIAMTLFVRTPTPSAAAPAAVAAIHRIDPNLAVTHVRTFEEAMAESLARERLNALMSATFGVSGLLLASLGLYGLLAFIVTERTKEIAIRVALGARARWVTWSVVGRGLRLVAAGAAGGVAGSLLLLRSLNAVLFDVTPYDAPTYLIVLGLLFGVAVLASYLPARRAARIEPLEVLRQE